MSGVHVLALDQSFRMTGWAVFRVVANGYDFLEAGTIETEKGPGTRADDDWRCLVRIVNEIDSIVRRYRISGLAVESPSGSKSVTAAKSMGYAYAAAAAIAAVKLLPAVSVSAMAGKKAVTGRKSASKDAVVAAVTEDHLSPGEARRWWHECNKKQREAMADAVAVWLAAWSANGDTVRQLRQMGARKAA